MKTAYKITIALVMITMSGCGVDLGKLDQVVKDAKSTNTGTNTSTGTDSSTVTKSVTVNTSKTTTVSTTGYDKASADKEIDKTMDQANGVVPAAQVPASAPVVAPAAPQPSAVVVSQVVSDGIIGKWSTECDDGIIFKSEFSADGIQTLTTFVYNDRYCQTMGQFFVQKRAFVTDDNNNIQFVSKQGKSYEVFKIEDSMLVLGNDETTVYRRIQ